MKVEHEVILDRTEMSMIRYICRFALKKGRKKMKSLERIVGIETSQFHD